MRYLTVLAAILLTSSVAWAQIPKNDNKEYEYYGEATVRKAGSGELQKRLAHWAEQYYKDEVVKIAVDDSTERFIEVDVTEMMVESHFGVKRKHTRRSLHYHIKFDAERKDFKYWINDIRYTALETNNKGEEVQLEGLLSELKTATIKSLEEETHMRFEKVMESFKEAAEKELEE